MSLYNEIFVIYRAFFYLMNWFYCSALMITSPTSARMAYFVTLLAHSGNDMMVPGPKEK